VNTIAPIPMCGSEGGAMVVHRAAAEGFAKVGDDYERGRPTYPAAAIDLLVEVAGLGPGVAVVDVAAGTGKLTRLLVGTGASVIAVEPIAGMSAVLRTALPSVEVLPGTAEDLPLADGSAAAITVGQAFHWFRGPEALAEMHRVLRPGGTLAVIFNASNDTGEPWVAAVEGVYQPLRGDAPTRNSGAWREAFTATTLFTPLESASFPNPQVITPEEMVARVRSISFIGAMPEPAQAEVLAGVADVLARHPDTAGRRELVLPYVTTLSWCRRR
jgi:SAM-dependent methyltransferase